MGWKETDQRLIRRGELTLDTARAHENATHTRTRPPDKRLLRSPEEDPPPQRRPLKGPQGGRRARQYRHRLHWSKGLQVRRVSRGSKGRRAGTLSSTSPLTPGVRWGSRWWLNQGETGRRVEKGSGRRLWRSGRRDGSKGRSPSLWP